MKIHIVQKGDTLWKIAKKYGVNFDALKQANTQLSNPDMIMPGMKIKVPTGNVQVKKEEQVSPIQKETQMNIAPVKEQKVEHPYADITPQPFPVMEEALPEVKEEVAGVQTGPYIPQMPQMPQFEIDINNYNLMNMQMPTMPPAPPNVLPGMMAPEEEEEILPPKKEVQMPQMQPMPQMPQMAPMQDCPPPCPPVMMPGCVPISPVMPGPGFNFGPGQFGGFPGQQMQGFRVEASPNLVAGESIDLPPAAPQQPVLPEMAPMPQFQQPMPQPMPQQFLPNFNCVPISPVMPGSGFNGFPMGPMGQGQPQMAPMMQPSPGMMPQGFGMDGDVAGAQFQQPPFMGNPMGPMNPTQLAPHYKKNDCGCGGPKPQFGGHYQAPMQAPFPVQGAQAPFGGYPGPGFQQPPFGVNPYQQVPYNPMFAMPDFDDDLDD